MKEILVVTDIWNKDSVVFSLKVTEWYSLFEAKELILGCDFKPKPNYWVVMNSEKSYVAQRFQFIKNES